MKNIRKFVRLGRYHSEWYASYRRKKNNTVPTSEFCKACECDPCDCDWGN